MRKQVLQATFAPKRTAGCHKSQQAEAAPMLSSIFGQDLLRSIFTALPLSRSSSLSAWQANFLPLTRCLKVAQHN